MRQIRRWGDRAGANWRSEASDGGGRRAARRTLAWPARRTLAFTTSCYFWSKSGPIWPFWFKGKEGRKLKKTKGRGKRKKLLIYSDEKYKILNG